VKDFLIVAQVWCMAYGPIALFMLVIALLAG